MIMMSVLPSVCIFGLFCSIHVYVQIYCILGLILINDMSICRCGCAHNNECEGVVKGYRMPRQCICVSGCVQLFL